MRWPESEYHVIRNVEGSRQADRRTPSWMLPQLSLDTINCVAIAREAKVPHLWPCVSVA